MVVALPFGGVKPAVDGLVRPVVLALGDAVLSNGAENIQHFEVIILGSYEFQINTVIGQLFIYLHSPSRGINRESPSYVGPMS